MKKKYIEPMMIVEDFTVSEMVAADCQILVSELKVVSQMSHPEGGGCDSGAEDKYFMMGEDWLGRPVKKPNGKGDAYQFFSNNYDGIDFDGDGAIEPEETMFTSAYRADAPAGSATCQYDPMEHGITFGYGYECTGDVTAIQKS